MRGEARTHCPVCGQPFTTTYHYTYDYQPDVAMGYCSKCKRTRGLHPRARKPKPPPKPRAPRPLVAFGTGLHAADSLCLIMQHLKLGPHNVDAALRSHGVEPPARDVMDEAWTLCVQRRGSSFS